MSKSTSRTLFLLGLLIWVIGAVVFGMSPDGSKLISNPGNITGFQQVTGLMATGGYLVMALGGILILLSWIGGLVRTAVLGRWGWFIVLLILGLIGLLVLIQLVYVFLGPTDRRVRRPVAAT